jgi:prepilin-type N-terminal cleavage/methylation domain-containing protein/prepilin-type processing-associated H-X9-DG protein
MDRTVKAFTLLELICVIAIIGLLMALLVPSLSKVRKISTRVICGSNMKGLGTVCAIYLNDSDDTFPDPEKWLYAPAADNSQHPVGCRWHDLAMAPASETMNNNKAFQGQMWEYLAGSKFPICPNFREIAIKRGCENPRHLESIDVIPQYNYTMNGYLGWPGDGGLLNRSEIQGYEEKSSTSDSSVSSVIYEESKSSRPSTVFFFAEENCWSVRPDHPRYPARWLNAPLSTKALDDTALLITPTPQAENCFATFHGNSDYDDSEGFGNAVFVDGHVDMITLRQQLRKTMHAGSFGGRSSWERYEKKEFYDPAGNLRYAWASPAPPPGGWDGQ